jgi:ABC-2 type transport system ATP-binding protein
VEPGTILALLGSNGAGKTTVVRILSTLLHADGGEATVNGFDVRSEAADVRSRSASPASSLPSTRC